MICPGSDSKTESRPVPTGRYISETEDEATSNQGQISRQLSPSSPRTGQTSLADTRLNVDNCRASSSWPVMGSPSREDADDREPQFTRMSLIESGATDDFGNATMTAQLRTGIISQTLAETLDNSTLSSKCRDLHSRLPPF
jgi:hypothetical protein